MLEKERYGIVRIGIVSAIMMLVIMLPSMIQNHGIFIIRGDYVDQYIPRLIKAREILTSGSGTWDWFNFLGASYNKINMLFSLNAVCLLFPAKFIPYAVTYMHLIRIALIAMCSYAYLRHMVRQSKTAFLGAILYTFSSYTFMNMEFMQFFEALWAFPLLLLSVEKMFTEDHNRHLLILSVFLNCATSFYFFVFSTLSFSLYFVCRFFLSEDWKPKRKAKFFLLAILEYVIGFLCAFLIFAPFLYSLFHSAGSTDKIGNVPFSLRGLVYGYDFVARMFSFFVPAASNRFNAFGRSMWSSITSYIPVFGMSFVLAFVFQRGSQRWLKVLSILSVLFLAVSGISLVYNMLSSTYTRYAYGMLLFFVLASVTFLERYDHTLAKRSVYLTISAFICLLCVYYAFHFMTMDSGSMDVLLHGEKTDPNTGRMLRIYTIITAGYLYLCLLGFIHSKTVRNKIIPLVITAILVYGCSYTMMNLNSHDLLDYDTESSIDLQTQAERYFIDIPETDGGNDHRIDFTKQLRNYSYTMKKPSIAVFESVRNIYSEEACQYLNYYDGSVTVFPEGTENELRTLLGVKYFYDVYPEDKLPAPEGFTYLKTDSGVDVYRNEQFIGMGFSYDHYMLRSEFERLAEGRESCADILLNTLIVEDGDEAFVSDLLKPYQSGTVCRDRESLENFQITSDGFSATFHSETPQIVYVSVPYESSGWEAEMNGKKIDFIRANIGFMAFQTEPGSNEIRFTFHQPVNKPGLCVSGFGLLVLILYLVIYHKRKTAKS